ncbi:MAG TPA: hypothetical protein VNV17_20110, partial [Solirubrobacteraceae bacterium]|nr:hypothetical protein [Solirubrobacteraceae bacterium]
MSETAAPEGSAVRVSPGAPSARWEVRVPGSKSLTNRALLLAGVATGQSRLINPLLADDTRVMADALRALGATIVARGGAGGGESVVTGIGGAPRGGGQLWCGMAGTAGRFLVAMVAAGSGHYVIDAHPQLQRRPLGPLLAALQSQGAAIEGDSFPLTVTSDGLTGGTIEVDASVSSQFLSALVMAAPLARAPTTLEFESLVSRPYLTLTLDVMRAFGVQVDDAPGSLRVSPQDY